MMCLETFSKHRTRCFSFLHTTIACFAFSIVAWGGTSNKTTQVCFVLLFTFSTSHPFAISFSFYHSQKHQHTHIVCVPKEHTRQTKILHGRYLTLLTTKQQHHHFHTLLERGLNLLFLSFGFDQTIRINDLGAAIQHMGSKVQ